MIFSKIIFLKCGKKRRWHGSPASSENVASWKNALVFDSAAGVKSIPPPAFGLLGKLLVPKK